MAIRQHAALKRAALPSALLAVAAMTSGPTAADTVAAQAFWDALASHCGEAFEGKRVIARDDRPDMLQGDERLIVHFRECSDELLALPFHIQKVDGSWDSSRTWRFTWYDDGAGIELRHDHRLNTGEPDADNTMYGGYSEPGTATMHRFVVDGVTADDGSQLGWQLEIVPGERYTYGTFRGESWTWRVDFDLSKALAEEPHPPWGFESTVPVRTLITD